ncbi:MAG: hypothetical protein IPP99_21275 [Chitinophagaceae bacterium]|nr:hypothetical protein [Chitinophagaceae bacterium]
MNHNNTMDSSSEGNSGMEQRLWDYIDGLSQTDEKELIGKLLKEDMAWKSKYEELIKVQDWLQQADTEQPSLRFTKNVMEEIARTQINPAAHHYINNRIIWGIGFFFIAMMVGILIYGFGQMISSPGEASSVSKSIGKLDFSKFFNNNLVNALMMINVVIGLFLLDNYLTNKRKQFRKEA